MITHDALNKNLLKAEYAVRGPIVIRAQQLEDQGCKIIYCNIGNPQALKQQPLTYLRQVLSLMEYPALLNNPAVVQSYPKDIVEKVRSILKKNPSGTGAYSQSAGIPFIRQAVADFISRRDGIPASKEMIILTDGASKGVQASILALLRNLNDGIMIPIPQYPLYSATISLYGGRQIGYYLDESHQWQLGETILNDSIETARRDGIRPVAITVINPGNPTGAVLSADNIKMIISFARRHSLAIFADEVYQENVYQPGAEFHSFARIMHEMNVEDVSLFSFHSVSKGFLGECGHRGGYLELRNIPSAVLDEMIKLQSISLCANLPGQIATYMMVAPPQAGDESYETYHRERNAILQSLKAKAELLAAVCNKIDGLSLDIPQGAMYAFIRLELPTEKGVDVQAMAPAERLRYESKRDFDYCMALLEETGICVVPGSGFGQMPGTLHFRTTFLPPKEDLEEFARSIGNFHRNYCQRIVHPHELSHA
jgi:alanine transaminase